MASFKIVTDSSCDLPPELAEQLDLTVLPLKVTLNDTETYKNDLAGTEIAFDKFYAKLRDKAASKTSAPSLDDFETVLRTVLEAGNDFLYIGFSSGLSATYQAGRLACENLSQEFSDRKIMHVDSLCASMGQGLLVYHAAKLAEEGKSMEEVVEWLEQNKLHLCHWFTVEDLNHLKRGGRVSPTTAFVGTLLSIKPVMHMDDAGTLKNVSKAKGRKASIRALLDMMKETAIDASSQTVFISHGDCIEDANALAEMVKAELGVKEVVISYVGPVIGSHSGPGTLALFFLGTQR